MGLEGNDADQPRTINDHLDAGRLGLKTGNATMAAQAFRSATALSPTHVGALSGLAAALDRSGHIEDAIDAVNAAIDVAPTLANLHVQLGCLLNAQFEFRAAAQAFQAALAVDGGHTQAMVGLRFALDRQDSSDPAFAIARSAITAIADARAAVAGKPDSATLHVRLGMSLLRAHNRHDAATSAFETALALDPRHPGAFGGLASAFERQGRCDEAITLLRNAISLWPNQAGLHTRLGQLFEGTHQLSAAAHEYRRAASIDPGFSGATQGLRRVRNPHQVFALFRRLVECANDVGASADLGAELDISTSDVSALIQFAIDPCEGRAANFECTPLEREMLSAMVRGAQRRSRQGQDAAPVPIERFLVAPPTTDELAAQASHCDWTPLQWLNSYLLRTTIPAFRTAVVVTARDEGLSLLEWVAHYRILGFDTIFVYSNDNVDGSEHLLLALARLGLIVYVQNQMDPRLNHHPQKKAYAHALHLVPELWEHEWVFFADCDEFLVPNFQTHGLRIGTLLDAAGRKFPERGPSAICFNWLLYLSGHAYRYEAGLILRRFQHAVGRPGMKSMVKIRDIFSMHLVHFPDVEAAGFMVRSDLAPMNKSLRWNKLPPAYGGAQLNHYWAKSFEEFSLKKARGDAAVKRDRLWKRDFELFFSKDAETAENHRPPPAELVTAVEAELARLLAFPEIAAWMAEIRRRLPKLIDRFESAGGLRSIYDATSAARVGASAL